MNEKKQQSNTQKYFTKEIFDRITGMSNSQMKELLKELEGTEFWIAILKYNQDRMRVIQDGLFSIDPFKDPTNMARNQGIGIGLSDLADAVVTLKYAAEKSENPETEEEKVKESKGGAYGVV